MILVLAIIVIFGFPALALWALGSGGVPRVFALTVLALVLLVGLTLFSASPAGGNRLVATRGFLLIASRSLLFYGLALGTPILATSLVVAALAPHVKRAPVLYAIAAASALAVFTAGTFLAVFASFTF